MPDTLVIRRATSADAEAIGTIGPAIYAESYAGRWEDAAGFAVQLATFGTAAVAIALRDPAIRMWVAETDGAIVGFLTMAVGSPDPVSAAPSGAEVRRIYLLPQTRGGGLGRRMVDLAERQAAAEGCNHLWLDAMAGAPWAWRTYVACGFTPLGRCRFAGAIRADQAEMIVLSRPIAPHGIEG